MQEASCTQRTAFLEEGFGSEQLFLVIWKHRFPFFPLHLNVKDSLHKQVREEKWPITFAEQVCTVWCSDWCDLQRNPVHICLDFFPVRVWLSQRGIGRKGAEEDEGLLWALPKVWTLVTRTNLDIPVWLNWLASCMYFPFSVHSLSPSLIHGGHKLVTDLIFRGSCFQLNWLRLLF